MEPVQNFTPIPTFDLAEQQVRQNAVVTRVYGWMSAGLLLTAAAAAFVASSQALMQLIFGNRFVFYALLLVELGVVWGLSAAIGRISTAAATAAFLGYSLLNGATLAMLAYIYTAESLGSVFLITAMMFGGMCLFGAVTHRDLTGVGSFMMMGLWGVIAASVVNWFVNSEAIYWITSYFGVFIFVGLTAYDAQKVKKIGEQAHQMDPEAAKRMSIMGALALYLDFINMFLFLLRILGRRR